ncbi:MAG: hypothetical protein ACC648_04610 [Thiohalobacterales bacterium]
MRHLIYFLVVANLIFFLWHAIQGTTVGESGTVLPPLPAGVESLVTLEERATAQAAKIESVTGSEPPGAGLVLSCTMLGPFYSAADMQVVEARLIRSGHSPVPNTSEEKVGIGYWLYMPEMSSETAQEITALFDSKDDREYFVGKGNLIALGAFRELSRAELRLEKVRNYGLEPLLEPRYRTDTVHWLGFPGPGNADVDLAAITAGFPDVEIQQRACE